MKKLLIVVDYQNDFVTGSLGFEGAVAIGPRIAGKIKLYRENGDQVAFTMDTHQADYLKTQEGQNLPVPHCLQETHGWQICDEILREAPAGALQFLKPSFGSQGLFDYLKLHPFQSIELCGVVTNICVISNAVLAKTAQPETPVLVDARCVAGNDATLHQKALDVMQSLHIRILNR